MAHDQSQTSVVDVALDWDISASVQEVWAAIFDRPEMWWPQAHRAGPAGSKMQFEPRIGGQLREERTDGAAVLWYTIFALEPMRAIDLSGHLAARYGGPATSLLNLEIRPGNADGTSALKLTDSVFGRLGPDMRTSLTDGWNAIIGEGLVRLLNKGE